jgi:hypothetical protein
VPWKATRRAYSRGVSSRRPPKQFGFENMPGTRGKPRGSLSYPGEGY